MDLLRAPGRGRQRGARCRYDSDRIRRLCSRIRWGGHALPGGGGDVAPDRKIGNAAIAAVTHGTGDLTRHNSKWPLDEKSILRQDWGQSTDWIKSRQDIVNDCTALP